MENKTLEVTVYQKFEYDDSRYPYYQSVECEEFDKLRYLVSNFMDDNYIGGDLLSAEKYIDAVKLGMKLAEQGYSEIKITYADAEDDDWD